MIKALYFTSHNRMMPVLNVLCQQFMIFQTDFKI